MYIVACFVDDIDSDVFMIFLLSLFLQFEMRYSNSLFSLAFPFKIGATRKTGSSNWGYKPPLLTRA